MSIDWNKVPHSQWPMLADYEEPTSEEAQNMIWSTMVDLYEDADEVALQTLAEYVLRSDEAQKFIVAQPQIGQALRAHVAQFPLAKSMAALLSRLGF